MIYIHVPFCRRACHYCDFHFSTGLRLMPEMTDALIAELRLRADYLPDREVHTIYLGGGTPSLIPTESLRSILDTVHALFSVNGDAEVTLEANPEDLDTQKLKELRSLGINRLSLGTQSFIDHELRWMNRMHTSEQAISVIGRAQDTGFDNISIDLIFGLPGQTAEEWQHNLEVAVGTGCQHISSYGLTVEERTRLHSTITKGTQPPPDDDMAARFFRMNMEFLPQQGFEHYEISNFARPGRISRHNSAYWHGRHYLGIGPSAHSYNGISRQWNIRSNAGYIQRVSAGIPFFEMETLSVNDRVNEHILTGLRCKWGVQKQVLESIDPAAWNRILAKLPELGLSNFETELGKVTLSNSGKLIADRLTAELFQGDVSN